MSCVFLPLNHCRDRCPLRSSLKHDAFGATFFICGWNLDTDAVKIFPLSFRTDIFEAQVYLPNMLSSFENYHFWKCGAFGIFPWCSKTRGTSGHKSGQARFSLTILRHVFYAPLSIIYKQPLPGPLSQPLWLTKLNICFLFNTGYLQTSKQKQPARWMDEPEGKIWEWRLLPGSPTIQPMRGVLAAWVDMTPGRVRVNGSSWNRAQLCVQHLVNHSKPGGRGRVSVRRVKGRIVPSTAVEEGKARAFV